MTSANNPSKFATATDVGHDRRERRRRQRRCPARPAPAPAPRCGGRLAGDGLDRASALYQQHQRGVTTTTWTRPRHLSFSSVALPASWTVTFATPRTILTNTAASRRAAASSYADVASRPAPADQSPLYFARCRRSRRRSTASTMRSASIVRGRARAEQLGAGRRAARSCTRLLVNNGNVTEGDGSFTELVGQKGAGARRCTGLNSSGVFDAGDLLSATCSCSADSRRARACASSSRCSRLPGRRSVRSTRRHHGRHDERLVRHAGPGEHERDRHPAVINGQLQLVKLSGRHRLRRRADAPYNVLDITAGASGRLRTTRDANVSTSPVRRGRQ